MRMCLNPPDLVTWEQLIVLIVELCSKTKSRAFKEVLLRVKIFPLSSPTKTKPQVIFFLFVTPAYSTWALEILERGRGCRGGNAVPLPYFPSSRIHSSWHTDFWNDCRSLWSMYPNFKTPPDSSRKFLSLTKSVFLSSVFQLLSFFLLLFIILW